MTREDKHKLVEGLVEDFKKASHFYFTDISGMNAETTSELRRACFKSGIELRVVKNTLIKKALEKIGDDYTDMFTTLKGSTSVMFTDANNAPAKLIKQFRRKNKKPILKAAYVEQSVYVGDNQLDALVNIKSKEELVADVVLLLKSPMTNLVSQLQSGANTIHGVLKTLEEKGK